MHSLFYYKRRTRDLLFSFGIPVFGSLLALGLAWIVAAVEGFHGLEDTEEAGTVFSVIAGIMATSVAALYSVLLVVQTLVSTQFSPRLVEGIAQDVRLKICTAFAVGTLFYCLIMLTPIGSTGLLSVGMGSVLALVSISVLLGTIVHTSRILQIYYIIQRVSIATRAAILLRMRHPFSGFDEAATPPVSQRPDRPFLDLEAERSGYVQTVHFQRLGEIARTHRIQMEMLVKIGEFATKDVPLVRIWLQEGNRAAEPKMLSRVEKRIKREVLEAFFLGPSPTVEQDPEYGIRLLEDVALKAISPAINDPSTAVSCIDHLESLLVTAAQRRDESAYCLLNGPGEDWVVRHSAPVTFEALLRRACRQLRHYGRSDFAVGYRLMRLLKEVAGEARCLDYLATIEEEVEALHGQLEPSAFSRYDIEQIEVRYREAREVIAEQRARITAPTTSVESADRA
jgi:uncharacterized membrane protein